MEEDKKLINSVEPLGVDEKESSLLPGINDQYSKLADKEEEKHLLPSRISNALSESVIATPQTIERKYNLTIQDSVIKEAVDENGKVPRLSVMQKKILLSLESHLSQLIEKPEIKDYIERLKKGENPPLVAEYISLEELCSDIFGKEEKWKSDKQNDIKKELQALSSIRQLQIYKVKALNNEGVEREAMVRIFAPYLSLTGEEKQIKIGKRTTIAVKILFGRIFLERISDRFFTILPSFWQAKKSNGEKIRTDHFYSLSTLAFNLAWSHYYIELPKAEQYIKKENILDTEKIEAIKESAMTHDPISFDRIKDIIKGKTEERSQKKRFKTYIWDAMWALIDYGLLSDKSRINWERETITLVYNEHYATPRQIERPIEPGKGYWGGEPTYLEKK